MKRIPRWGKITLVAVVCLIAVSAIWLSRPVQFRPVLMMTPLHGDMQLHYTDELMQDEAFVAGLIEVLDGYAIRYRWSDQTLMVPRSVMSDRDLAWNFTTKAGGTEAWFRIHGKDQKDWSPL